MSQQPKSVKVGGDVIIVCNATSVTVKNFNLSWTDEEGSGLPDNVKGDPVSTSNGSIINATLTVTGLKADLKKVVCKVEADGKQQNKTHNIGESYGNCTGIVGVNDSCISSNIRLCFQVRPDLVEEQLNITGLVPHVLIHCQSLVRMYVANSLQS